MTWPEVVYHIATCAAVVGVVCALVWGITRQ
jgi:hypothetical protein